MAKKPPDPRPTPAPPESAADLLRRLDWTVLRRLDGLLQGDYRTVLRGTGLDLADLREYQHHDDVRHIDWNVTARLQQPYVRVFTGDREMAAWFVLDLSASVDFGSGRAVKRQVATEFVAALSRLLTRHGNRVGALLFGGPSAQTADVVIPPRADRRHVLHLLHTIGQHQAGSQAQDTLLHEWLRRSASLIKRRSTVFVLSDFICDA
ncbi:MAG: hypothetical protein RLZZ401_2371, partial [Pseudomonadota bacterium]